MKASAQHLKLIVRNTPAAVRPATIERKASNSPEVLYAALADLAGVNRRAARHVAIRITRDLRREMSGRRRSRVPRQLELFQRAVAGTAPSVEQNRDVISLPSPFLLEDVSDPCPACGQRLVERSRVGTHLYCGCLTRDCPNSKALFLVLLVTGDD